MCIVLKSVQLYTPVATCMYLMLKVIEKKSVCVWGERGGGWGADDIKLSIIMHFLCGRSRVKSGI